MSRERERVLARLAAFIAGVDAYPARVAVDGPDAAGKTTLADELAPLVEAHGRPVIRASIDGFHRPRRERYGRGGGSPEGYYLDSFDYPALRRVLLEPLGPGGNRRFRRAVFDYRADAPVQRPVEVAPREAILLFDGVFLARPELAECWDLHVYVSVTADESVRRAAERDVALFGSAEAVRAGYRARYVPGQELYRKAVRPEEIADVVVDNNDPTRPRVRRAPREFDALDADT